jgi:glycerol-3-phosphate dehydrogenase (NAD(P)+)
MRISVLGAGAWGTALAIAAARRHRVLLWARDAVQARQMAAERRNARYLPQAAWPEELGVTSDHAAVLAHAEGGLIIVATPMAALRETLADLPADACVFWLCKGVESASGALGHQVAASVLPKASVGVLSGPSLRRRSPAACPRRSWPPSADPALCELAVDALHRRHDPRLPFERRRRRRGGRRRQERARDRHRHRRRPAARAQRARRAHHARARGDDAAGRRARAQAETFTGLSGLGDLVLTATGDLSRNRRVGMMLAQGLDLARILEKLGHVAEGVYCADTVTRLAHEHGVAMPIADAVSAVIHRRLAPRAAVVQLMRRDSRFET